MTPTQPAPTPVFGEPASVSIPPSPEGGRGTEAALTLALRQHIAQGIAADGGWWPFDRFMAAALYEPGLGYYANGRRKFGAGPASGSDFVTAPELSSLFGATLATVVGQALDATATHEVWEFGAGSGALAEQLLDALGDRVARYTIVDLSADLRERQQARLGRFGDRVQWAFELPERFSGLIVGNEVLDAMPVQLLHWTGAHWQERGVAVAPDGRFVWADQPTVLRPPRDGQAVAPGSPEDNAPAWSARFLPGAVCEVHPQAEAFIRTLVDRLVRGAAFFLDYGFPEHELYHPQRHGGTLMCHRGHVADTDPLVDVGLKDLTAHVNFTGIAMAGQGTVEAPVWTVLGYTSQARFLLNAGLAGRMADASIPERSAALKLVNEHEMGELFKVIGFATGDGFESIGFAAGDRSHTL